MSGGKRIEDHKFFGGGMSRESVLPKGVHVQTHSDDGHGGHEAYYEDTDAAIKSAQMKSVKTAKGHKQRDGYRN
jgi:hypothetical protein